MYHVIGYENTSFTSRQSGDFISGVNIYFALPIDSGEGYRDSFRKFFSDSALSRLGGIDFVESIFGHDVDLNFDHNGRLLSIALV